MSIMGTRVVRREDPLFLSRGATYTDDLTDERLTGALHLTLVRSPLAHARITSIDVEEARSAPGVVAVVTGAEIDLAPALLFPGANKSMVRSWLPTDKVRFVGEPVVAVLTEEAYQGQDAADLVEIDYDPLPAVVDLKAAATDEVLLFEEAGTNTSNGFGLKDEFDEHLFDDCEVVVTREIVNQRLAAASLETRAASAVWGADGRLTLWCSTQNAQASRDEVAGWLGVDAAQVHVITPDVGGGFGAKIGADPEFALVSWLAKHTGRPVRWNETRSENMTGMVQGRAQLQTVTIGGSRDGRVTAYRLDVLADAGAYPRLGAVLPMFTRMMAPGVYDIEKVESRARVLVTTTTSTAAYRGAGRPEATAAIERAMDMFAAEIGMDPAEVRRRNLLQAEQFPLVTKGGAPYDSGEYEKALDAVLEASGYADLRAEQKRRRDNGEVVQLGIGVSVFVEITGGGAFSEDASVEVHPDGSVTVLTGTSPHGQGHATAWAMLASEHLGIGIDRITVKHGDTDLIPRGAGTMGSRSLQTGGIAVYQAAGELVELAKQRAADLLEANVDDLEVADGSVNVRGTDKGITLAALAEKERLQIDSNFDSGAPTFPFGAHVAVVEVDVESGKAVVDRIITVDDAGPVLNPLLCEGQRHGGIAQGISQALLEEVVYDADGNPLTATFADYAFPSAAELPSFTLLEMATPTHVNPLGVKGIGEAGTIGATPAVQSAVVDAVSHLGVRHIDMPTSPLRVWEAINAASAEGTK
ncbi:xanthine dehydrogenase family protein molybdopterin-binding subunit [Pseudonocardia sp. KRD-184]|uniref:Xanthine dehydrogenase family protein molybdopterin-binding subunit n=1 Tax=Pseudonocardia oceani TaxID=2792013 RepID=A0ABS6U7T4_9PSEU|nr:xanthine dehydrogenase family protein molybdopterin-binding subunit [Pseudonocardia oceani]MBW0091181.1 xanthine dehydrogenase family protein molybdopterin-binding subunit [Pseudonocardia oceani]MBW0098260.1 xanthine dehydrogenase family protein molybdopterin-binding subunit [Pseudonocardia oceani]MBW0110859.1 xanthine dehydrogenase family protein molybdopterin-binding subunit [Pseudonocardia oceani]MBW0122852.1 xanthine dehydrogenase family protein molybdopterin-binding subunit [Pseudonocar